MQQGAIRQGCCAEYDTIYADIQHLLDVCKRAQTTAEFYAEGCFSAYASNQRKINRLALRGCVQINDMQPTGSCCLPALGDLHRVGGIGRDLVVIPLIEPHTLPVFDINCREDDHMIVAREPRLSSGGGIAVCCSARFLAILLSCLDFYAHFCHTVLMNKTIIRTISIKLDVDGHKDVLQETQKAFNAAASWIASVCWEEGITNTNTAHHRVYGETRARYGLGSQLACCARAKAVEASKATKTKKSDTCPQFGPRGSIRYDARTYRLMSLDRVSLNTMQGRVVCRLILGKRQHAMLTDPDWQIGGADLIWRNGIYYLNVTQSKDAPELTQTAETLGVDLGIVNLATDSTGETFSGEHVKTVRTRYQKRRQILQSVGTHSAKRRLKKVSGREKRFQKDVNHRIAKTLVHKAVVSCKALALEDLTGIRERVTVRHENRYERHSWAFYQLRLYIAYKAAWASIPVRFVDPRNTSRTCSQCGHCEKANRQNQASFKCKQCGFCLNADINAAINISRAEVKRPMVSASNG